MSETGMTVDQAKERAGATVCEGDPRMLLVGFRNAAAVLKAEVERLRRLIADAAARMLDDYCCSLDSDTPAQRMAFIELLQAEADKAWEEKNATGLDTSPSHG